MLLSIEVRKLNMKISEENKRAIISSLINLRREELTYLVEYLKYCDSFQKDNISQDIIKLEKSVISCEEELYALEK